jgi:CHAT domain-containing protein
VTLQLAARNNCKQQLVNIFTEAEQCYLKDDYQQLESCLKQYADIFKASQEELGDSIDVYRAYYAKMCGAYYYGFAEEDSCDYYSEMMYRISLNTFNQRNNVVNAMVLHEELAQLYYKTKSYYKAKIQLDSVFNYYDERLNDLGIVSVKPNYYRVLSQLAMCNARLGDFDLALSQIDEAFNDYYKKQKDTEYYETLRKRGKILMLQADSLGSTHYKKAVECYQRYLNERYAVIGKEMNGMTDSQRGQYWLATHQFLYDCYRLGNYAPEMLYDLALFSKDYLIRKDAKQINWKDVRKSLGKSDCAIEFIQYFGKNDEKRLGCLVLKSNSKKPLFIDMFSTDSLLSLPLTNLHTIGSAIITSVSTVKDTLYKDERLPELIWKKSLLAAIGDAQKVYFAPDGLLHQMAIEYLMSDTTKICYRLTSTRKLTKKHTTPKMESALLCGGIEYAAKFMPSNRDNDVVAYRFLAPHTTTIKNLPGARKEVDSIFAFRNNPQDTLLVGETATDEAFLQALKRHYDVIHLSTHGYFGGRIGIYNDIKPLLNDESMSKSGLLFAGSANTLTDKTFDENLFDGVLSATELSKLDFSKTELIVLSACQTGLGHLTEDGVYGIQRGLKLAGANAMILTLWSVNDNSSSVLLRYFYQELEKQPVKDIHRAFLKARQQLMKEEKTYFKFDESDFTIKKETIRYNTPSHVNPFIIIDAY